MALDLKKLHAKFAEEAQEHCSKIERALVMLEKNPLDQETLNELFRSAHTVKGGARMMKLASIAEAAHKMEDLMDALRYRRVAYSSAISDVLFKANDAICEMVRCVAQGTPVTVFSDSLSAELAGATAGKPPSAQTVPSPSLEQPANQVDISASESIGQISQGTFQPQHSSVGISSSAGEEEKTPVKQSVDTVRIKAENLDELIKLIGETAAVQSRLDHNLGCLKEGLSLSARNLALISSMNQQGIPSAMAAGWDEISKGSTALHALLKQVLSSFREDAAIQQLLTGELRNRSLTMRMLPLSTIFDSFPRTVREISKSLGKQIDFQVYGGETELDKKIIEKIGDSLIHMIRNAIDHGIEPPAERKTLGKKERGSIQLNASYESGHVVVSVHDDGRGISAARLKEKARQRRLFDETVLNKMTEAEILDLIFLPGFSTSAIITDLSGRGVGMDVVKKNIIDELKGSIQIKTKENRGTTFIVKLPLTMALTRLLLISAASQVVAVPSNYVTEVLSVGRQELISVLERKALRLRRQIIPVESLSLLLGLPVQDNKEKDQFLIVLLKFGNDELGLMVDAFLNEEELMIKPLPRHLKNLPLVSGISIGGNNEIINVLQVPMLMKAAKEVRTQPASREVAQGTKSALSILVVDDSLNTREIEKSILESYGYRVELANDGAEALEKAHEKVYDVVITDVEMPRLDGFTLTEQLKSYEPYREIPVIIVTSREKEEDKRRGIQVGASAYIVKGSFDQTNLLETVQNLAG